MFSRPIPLGLGAATGWLSLASGHLELSDAAANLCGYTAEAFATQRKLVASYQEAAGGGSTMFAM